MRHSSVCSVKLQAPTNPQFFATPREFRAWLRKQHQSARDLWVGFHRKATARPSLTWPEAVDEALCFGWIDGIRKRCDDSSYMIRFTPRRSTSTWSAVNIGRVQELTKEERMQPAGDRAFAARREAKSGVYSYEQRKEAALDPAAARLFRANNAAWQFFQAQSPGYRKLMTFWVISAKRPETREKRLQQLFAASANEKRLR